MSHDWRQQIFGLLGLVEEEEVPVCYGRSRGDAFPKLRGECAEVWLARVPEREARQALDGPFVDRGFRGRRQAARGLLKLGVRPGDRVAILSDNCPEWIVVDQAVLGLGAIVVPLYTTSGLEETAHVISDSGAKVIAANGPEMVKKILGLGASIPEVTAIVAMHAGAESTPPPTERPPS